MGQVGSRAGRLGQVEPRPEVIRADGIMLHNSIIHVYNRPNYCKCWNIDGMESSSA